MTAAGVSLRRAARFATLCVLSVTVAGCSAIRFDPDEPPATPDVPPAAPDGSRVDLEGTYVGSLLVEGQRMPARLDLAQAGDALEAVLRITDVGITAEGEGGVDRDGTFELELAYTLECPGTAHLRGRWVEGSLSLDGTVTAADCTGSQSGEFAFRRR